MTRHNLFRLSFGLAILGLSFAALALTPQPALAQHGGGHASAGGHSSSFGGGGAHVAGYTGSRPAASRPSSHSNATPPAHPSTNAARIPTSSSLPPGMIGALRRATSGQQGTAAFSGPPAHTTIGFPPVEGNATAFAGVHAHSGPLSFSGEGHEIWENSAPAADATTKSPAVIGARPLPPHIIHGPPPVFYPGYYYPAFGYYGFYPFLGLGWYPGCDPTDPSQFGCGAYGLGYGYNSPYYSADGSDSGNGYGYQNQGAYPPSLEPGAEPPSTNGLDQNSPDESSPDTANGEPYDVNAHNSWQEPPGDSGAQPQAKIAAPLSVIYLQDGTNYDVRDYWVSGGELHYVTSYGGENSVALSKVDVQRSVDANAARGLSFSLHPAAPLNPPPSSDNAQPQPSPNAPPQQ